jgi:glyoxylase-like metal-dependent hydrolase (beta-lactamase superfamily II)
VFPAALRRPAHYAATGVRVDKFDVGPYENNAFVVRCTETGQAVLIDAANEHDRLAEICEHAGVRRVLTTHGHWDHIQAVVPLRDAGLDIAIGADDASMLPTYDTVLHDDEVIPVGRLRLRTIHNPGHTPGSISFLLEGHPVLFTGDTLFPGGPGHDPQRARGLPDDHRVDRPAAVHAAGGHARPARPRSRHDDRPRAPAPAGVDRPGLVGPPAAGAGARLRPSVGEARGRSRRPPAPR